MSKSTGSKHKCICRKALSKASCTSTASAKLSSQILNLLSTQEHSDLILKVGSENPVDFFAHSLILKIRSPVFEAMLSETWKREEGAAILLPGDDPTMFEKFLQSVYGSPPPDSIEDTMAVMVLAQKYLVASVIEDCRTQISDTIQPSNAVAAYNFAKSILSSELMSAAFFLILSEFKKVAESDSFFKIDPETMGLILENNFLGTCNEQELYLHVIRWIRHQEASVDLNPTLPSVKLLIPLIRFPLMCPGFLADFVKFDNVLHPEELVDLFCYFHSRDLPNRQLSFPFSDQPRMSKEDILTDVDEIEVLSKNKYFV